MDFKSYTDAIDLKKAELSDYVSKNIAAIQVPASKTDLQVGKKNMLTDSGWVFNVLGIIAFIAGLILRSNAIWITGCAALTAGIYLVVKGKQHLVQEAYDAEGSKVFGSIEKVIAYVSGNWTDFVLDQNASLRRDIVNSPLSVDDKVKALGRITDSSYLHVDVDSMKEEVDKIDLKEKLPVYKAYLPRARKRVSDALDLAAVAQADVFSEIAGPMPAPRKDAPKPASSAPGSAGNAPSKA